MRRRRGGTAAEASAGEGAPAGISRAARWRRDGGVEGDVAAADSLRAAVDMSGRRGRNVRRREGSGARVWTTRISGEAHIYIGRGS